jgi:hypothetical protein
VNENLDWKFKPRRWRVLYDDPSTIGSSNLKAADIVSIEPTGKTGLVLRNSSTLGPITLKSPETDLIEVTYGGSSRNIKRRVCLICQKNSTVHWVAREEVDDLLPPEECYEWDWRLRTRRWTVIYSAVSDLKPGDKLQFPETPLELKVIPGTGSMSPTPWGNGRVPVHAEDAVTLTALRGGIGSAQIRRRVCLIGPSGASGGATWVAEEGGGRETLRQPSEPLRGGTGGALAPIRI